MRIRGRERGRRATRALLLGALLATRFAAAQTPGRARVVVLHFDGPYAAIVHEQVVAGIVEEHEVLGQEDWNHVAARLGVAPVASASAVARIAPELRAQAAVSGTIRARQGRGPLLLTLAVRHGTTGETIKEARYPVTADGLSPKHQRWASQFVAKEAARGEAGEPTLPPEAPAGVVESAGDEWTRPAGVSFLDASVGLTLVARSFEYGDSAARLRSYDLGAVPGFRVALEAYPLTLVTGGFASGVGLAFAYGQVFSLDSKVEDRDEEMGSSLREMELGLRYRARIERAGLTVKGLLGWGRIAFSIDWDPALGEPELLDATHDFLRLGAAGELDLGSLPLRAGLALSLLAGFGAGELDAGGIGGDVLVGADWSVTERLAVGPRFRFTQLSLSDAATGRRDPALASATDRYLGGSIDATYRF